MAIDTGTGLLLSDGDAVFDAAGRLVLISGAPALLQDLTVRLLTPLGSDPFHTGYGLDVRSVFSQANSALATQESLRLNLVRTLGTDRRVSEVRQVTITSTDRRIWSADVELITVDGATLTIPFSTAGT